MPESDPLKVCPFCRERVHPEAIKCRYCQSMLLPAQPAAEPEAPPADKSVTYVVDRGFIRFAKFVGGAVAVIVAAGVYLIGFDMEKTLQTSKTLRKDLDVARKELRAARGGVGDSLAQMKSGLSQLKVMKQEASAELAAVREQSSAASRQLAAAQEQSNAASRQLADSQAEIERRTSKFEQTVASSRSQIELDGQLAIVGIRQKARDPLAEVTGTRQLTPEEQAARTQLPPASTPRSRYLIADRLWPVGKTVRIRFLDGTAEVQQKVIEAARQWERHANIRFDFGEHPEAEARISFEQAGSWSYNGTDALAIESGQPTMNFGWLNPGTSDQEYRRVVLHQFGHLLGMIEEHTSPNADIPWDEEKVYRYYQITNGWDPEMTRQKVLGKLDGVYREFDPLSIMQFSVPNELTVGDFEIGWNTELSESDKNFIAELYPGA